VPRPELHLVATIPEDPELSDKCCRQCGASVSLRKAKHRDYLCAECTRKRIRAWEAAHPEIVRERKRLTKARFREAHPERILWDSAKARASRDRVPFTITVSDILIPPCCPVLGIPLQRKVGRGGGDASPSLDRLIPEKGYVPGNISVISNKANRIKSNASPEDLRRVHAWLVMALNSIPEDV
jgi:hypothetical protein